jgi:hypothetical protein
MGILLERYISRTATNIVFPALDPAMGYNLLPQLLRVDYQDVKHYTLFEAIPAVTYTHRDRHVNGELTKEFRQPDLSLTLKYGITSDLFWMPLSIPISARLKLTLARLISIYALPLLSGKEAFLSGGA